MNLEGDVVAAVSPPEWRSKFIVRISVNKHKLYDLKKETVSTNGHQESRKFIFSLNVHFLSDTSCY